MSDKTCFKCGRILSRSAFYSHPKMADGLLGKCKECTRSDVRLHRLNNIEAHRAYDAARARLPHRVEAAKSYARTDAGKRSHRRASAKQALLYPEKRAARVAVGNALRDGRLVRSACACGNTKVQAHHRDYSIPLDVEWLCSGCHRDRHR